LSQENRFLQEQLTDMEKVLRLNRLALQQMVAAFE
jgi:hypothetical protein